MIEFIRQENEAGHHSISKMRQLLDVHRATYYRKINPIPTKSMQEQELLGQRVQKLMKRHGLQSITIKKFKAGSQRSAS